jgi:hypothetical protein
MQILIAASPRDLRLARICIASIRHFYPSVEVTILPGAPLPSSFLREVAQTWNVGVFPVPVGHYGWGYVKLEPLFTEPGTRFLILDADTLLTGPIIESLESRFQSSDAPSFIVDEEDSPESEMRRLYYDWDKLAEVTPSVKPPHFVFNSGQWAGNSGVLNRADFEPWIDWTFPRRLKFPNVFKNGDQGVFNFILHHKADTDGLSVVRQPLMHWPGNGMDGYAIHEVLDRAAPARVVHWAGLKKLRLAAMPGTDLLRYFERAYYAPIRNGQTLRLYRAALAVIGEVTERFKTRVRLFWRHKVQSRIKSV